jgi:hypothetical protein
MKIRHTNSLAAIAIVTGLAAAPGHATTGPGCLKVVNVAPGDALVVRSRPAASAAVVDRLAPDRHGIIHLDGKCRPLDVPWGSRWCPVTHYDGDRVSKGWVRARFVRDSECP